MNKETKIEKQSEATEVKQEPKSEQVSEGKKPEQPAEQQEPKHEAGEPKEPKESKELKESDNTQKEIEELKRQLSDAVEQNKEIDVLNSTVSNMKAEIESKDNVIKEYEELLQNLFDTKMQQIPDQYKDLVPDNLDLKQKLSWLEKAEAKGLFDKKEKLPPAVEVGKPMNVDVPKADIEKLGASSLLQLAYNTIKR